MENLMDEFCATVHNYFEIRGGAHRGTFTIENGAIRADFLRENQYFRVLGSVFNDGVHKYPTKDMTDETFTGTVIEMAVPPSVLAFLADVEVWLEEYGDVSGANYSPYTSESFNNYSYSKGTVSRATGTSGTPMTWKDAFADRLTRWRKIG